MRSLDRDQLLVELRALKPQLEREGITHLSLFGSRARGDNRPDSDVDLVVDVQEGRKFSMLDAIGVGHVIEDALGLSSSIVARPGLDDDSTFKREVQRDEVSVF